MIFWVNKALKIIAFLENLQNSFNILASIFHIERKGDVTIEIVFIVGDDMFDKIGDTEAERVEYIHQFVNKVNNLFQVIKEPRHISLETK